MRCGALTVYEAAAPAIIDDERRHKAFGLLMSLNMLMGWVRLFRCRLPRVDEKGRVSRGSASSDPR